MKSTPFFKLANLDIKAIWAYKIRFAVSLSFSEFFFLAKFYVKNWAFLLKMGKIAKIAKAKNKKYCILDKIWSKLDKQVRFAFDAKIRTWHVHSPNLYKLDFYRRFWNFKNFNSNFKIFDLDVPCLRRSHVSIIQKMRKSRLRLLSLKN